MVGKDSHQVDQKSKKRNFLQEKQQKFGLVKINQPKSR
tara:strand:+ start:571 stop:684 length:114 start_codon:yes stop_codon:yes gene_type:complete